MLTLVVAKGYISKLLANENISQHIAHYHKDIFEGLKTVMNEAIVNPNNLVEE